MFSRRAGARVAVVVCSAIVGAISAPGIADAATTKWAVVDSAGVFVRGSGVTSTGKLGTGSYEVIFNKAITGCAYEAASGETATHAVTGPIEATVTQRGGTANGVFVQTFDQATGSLADRPFHLVTYCDTKKDFAVIFADGTTARGSHVVSSQKTGTGLYEVVFDARVSKCAFTATIGGTGANQIASPGAITVAGVARDKHAVAVTTLARSGASVDVSFHLAVDCGAAKLTGVISSSGVAARGKNVVSSQHFSSPDSGIYEVIFNRDVTACAYIATIGDTGTTIDTDAVTITTASRAGNAGGVFIAVKAVTGVGHDEPFHLTVTC